MRLVLPLQQHLGKTCTPIVQVGDHVQKGQLIAVPSGLGAKLHASASGVISEVTQMTLTIEADEMQPNGYVKIPETSDYLEAIEAAGVVGAGGAGFPTHVKLKTKLPDGCVIANLAECEPLLHHNICYVEAHAEVVIRGVNYLKKITGASRGLIAIKPKHRKAVRELEKALTFENGIELFFLPDEYPAGDERVIVREILGVELAPGQLPLTAGAVIDNVETLRRIVEAIELRRPVITKDITVAGRVKDARSGRVFFDVPLGVPVKNYIDQCGGYEEPHGEIVLGGPFTGKHGEDDSPVTKTLGGVLVAMPAVHDDREIGLLACECGAQEGRLKELASDMGAVVVAVEKCKRMVDTGNGRFRCNLPGVCPGQAESVLSLKRKGAKVLMVGTCGH